MSEASDDDKMGTAMCAAVAGWMHEVARLPLPPGATSGCCRTTKLSLVSVQECQSASHMRQNGASGSPLADPLPLSAGSNCGGAVR